MHIQQIIDRIKSGELTRENDTRYSNGFWDLSEKLYFEKETTLEDIFSKFWLIYEIMNKSDSGYTYNSRIDYIDSKKNIQNKAENNLERFIALKLGETSMCWSETPKGRFESEKVSKILDEIMEYIRTTYPLGDCVGEIGKEKAIDNLKRYESDLKAEWLFSVDTVATLTPPTELNWSELKQTSIDQTATPGTFTLNPETLNKNYEGITPLILDMSEYIGKPRTEVFQSVIKKYSTTHYIPDYSYLTYLRDNPDQFQESMKDGNWYYTPATVLGSSNGCVVVPCVEWYGDEPGLGGSSVGSTWGSDDRVLLLPR